jgi:signal peptidase II
MSPKLRTVLVILLVVLPLDQVTKWWVAENVSPFEPIVLVEGFFRITHARNPGGALGFFQGVPPIVFIGLTLVALWLVASFYRSIPKGDVLSATALGLILSGALGNLADRVRHGEVIDFLQFDLSLFVFPDFNVADSAIVVGVALLLLDVVALEAEHGAREASGPKEPTA